MLKWFAALLLACAASLAAAQNEDITYFFTYQQPDGNRITAGTSAFPNVTVVDYPAASAPLWVLGSIDMETGQPHWRFLLGDGSFYLTTSGGSAMPVALRFPPGAPLTYAIDPVETYYPSAGADASTLTHPIFLGRPTPPENNSLYIAQNGDVVSISGEREINRLPLNALPDARPVVSQSGQIALYTGATDQRYAHGVLGDALEAAALTILSADGANLAVAATIQLEETSVFEGISPMWADVDGDGSDDLITTISSAQVGAALRVYRADGSLLASSDSIGQGGRWRHQLAFGAFGAGGEMELVEIQTPHIGGVVNYFRLDGDRLVLTASMSGYSSHAIGSRNLDMGVAGDFNGDGSLELVVPDQAQTRLAALQRTPDGAAEVWSLPLDGTLTSNLYALRLPDGRLALAAGTSGGLLRTWTP